MKKSLFPRLALMAVVVALVSAYECYSCQCLYGSQYQHEIIG